MTLPGGCVCVLSHFSRVWLCATLWTVAWQVPLAVHGILQARTLEWVATSFSRGSSQRRDRTRVSKSPALAGGFFTTEPPLVPRHHYTSLICPMRPLTLQLIRAPQGGGPEHKDFQIEAWATPTLRAIQLKEGRRTTPTSRSILIPLPVYINSVWLQHFETLHRIPHIAIYLIFKSLVLTSRISPLFIISPFC